MELQTTIRNPRNFELREAHKEGAERVAHLLLSALHRNYSLKTLVRTALINEYDLKRIFRQVHGKNIHALVIEHRIKLAKKLLADPGKPVAEIAEACGYKPDYFTLFFRRKTGLTPTAYRQHLKHSIVS